MAVNTNFQVPFIPQEGITSQILSALQLANEQHRQRQQLAIQQQQADIAQQRANVESQRAPSEIQESAARAGLLGEEQKQKQIQNDQLKENMQFFSQPAQPQGQQAAPGAAGNWMPSNTPAAFAPIMRGLLPENLDSNEQKVMEAASQAGAAKATSLGGTKADYLNAVRSGVNEVVSARNAKMKPEGQRQISADEAQTVNQARQQLFPQLPQGLMAKAGDTKDQTDRIDKLIQQGQTAQATAAQRAQTNEIARGNLDIRQALLGMQQQKFDTSPIIAYDPQTKERVQTTKGEAQQLGYTNPVPVTEAQLSKHADTANQLNDAQLNVSRTAKAYQNMGELSLSDKRAVAAIEGSDKFHAEFGFGKQGVELPVDWYNRLLNNENFKMLSPQAKAAVVGDLSLRPAVIAYTKALTNVGRFSDKTLQMEEAMLPNAGMDPDTRDQLLNRFQQNIDQVAKIAPRMPGVDRPKDVKSRIEAEPQAQYAPPPPAQTLGNTFPNAQQFFRSLLGVNPQQGQQ